MFEAAAPADAAPTDPSLDRADDGARSERMERRMRMLEELAELGMEMAREVRRQAVAQAPEAAAAEIFGEVVHGAPAPKFTGDLGLVFSRIARAVRQTLALEARLDEALQARRRQAEAARAEQRAEARARVSRRRQEVRRLVEHNITATCAYEDTADLLDDLNERLFDLSEDAGLADQPLGELVAGICRDLGVEPDWTLWKDEDWAIAQARAEARWPPPEPSGPKPGPEPGLEPGPEPSGPYGDGGGRENLGCELGEFPAEPPGQPLAAAPPPPPRPLPGEGEGSASRGGP